MACDTSSGVDQAKLALSSQAGVLGSLFKKRILAVPEKALGTKYKIPQSFVGGR